MAASHLTSSFQFSRGFPGFSDVPVATPKGFIRVKTTEVSIDSNRPQFMIDLTKVTKGGVQVKALSRIQTKRPQHLRLQGSFRTMAKCQSFIDSSPSKSARDEPLKGSLNDSFYERQKQWKEKL